MSVSIPLGPLAKSVAVLGIRGGLLAMENLAIS
jgi:hypothetical protein